MDFARFQFKSVVSQVRINTKNIKLQKKIITVHMISSAIYNSPIITNILYFLHLLDFASFHQICKKRTKSKILMQYLLIKNVKSNQLKIIKWI